MAPKKACPAKKGRKGQKGGFELAGPAAAGLLLLLQEVARRYTKKSKKTMHGGAGFEVKNVEHVYIAYKENIEGTESKQLIRCTLVPPTSDDPAAITFSAIEPIAADAAGLATAAVLSAAADSTDAVATAAAAATVAAAAEGKGEEEGETPGGGKKHRKKKTTRGGADVNGFEGYMNSVGQEMANKFMQRFQGVVGDHAQMLPAVPTSVPAVPVPVAGGAKKKSKAAGKVKRGGGSCAASEHFGIPMDGMPSVPLSPAMPTGLATGLATGLPTALQGVLPPNGATFTQAGGRRRVRRHGGGMDSLAGML
jgi:hypothetical protein